MSVRDIDIEALLAEVGLSPPCDAKDVQRARRARSKEFHPDRAPPGEAAGFLERMKRINAAADDLLEYCALYGGIDTIANQRESSQSRTRSDEQQYDFWRDRWQEEEAERQARRERAAQDERRRREAERERMRREYEEYRERRRRSHSDDERGQREHERARAAARRALDELEQMRMRATELAIRWEEARARLDAAVAAFHVDPVSDSALWRLYGALFASFAAGSEYREAIAPLEKTWRDNAETLVGAWMVDAAPWHATIEEAAVRRLETQRFTVDLAAQLEDSLGRALVAADERMVSRTSPAARRALGALLEIRRILGLDGDRDEHLKAYWTAPNVAPLNLAMGAISKVIPDKGFAFVTRYGGGKDVFLHATAMPPGAFEKVMVGAVLTYRVKETDRGPQATDAEFVSGTVGQGASARQ